MLSGSNEEILENQYIVCLEHTQNLIELLNERPQDLQYLTPETKGRILFELYHAEDTWRDQLYNLRHWDQNKRREDATLLLLTLGIHSHRDWQETMEHMGEWQGDRLTRQFVSEASLASKARRKQLNEEALHQVLLNDEAKWEQLLQHLLQLPH